MHIHCMLFIALWTAMAIAAAQSVDYYLLGSHCDIAPHCTAIPPAVYGNPIIKSLNASGLQSLDNIELMTQLTDLRIYGDKITSIPDTIGSLTLLRDLIINAKNVVSISDALGSLPALRTLRICNVQAQIPGSIGDLNIEYLSISECPQVKDLQTLGSLAQLKYLHLKNNALTQLPPQVEQLLQLVVLDVSENELQILPISIQQLENLTSLNAADNLLTTLPSEMQTMIHLDSLTLARNSLASLPDFVGSLPLTTLNLTGNSLKVLPSSILNLSSGTRTILVDNHDFEDEGSVGYVGKNELRAHFGGNVFFTEQDFENEFNNIG